MSLIEKHLSQGAFLYNKMGQTEGGFNIMPRFQAVIKKHEEYLEINSLGDWLYNQYVNESQSYREIMAKLNTKSNRTIKKLMDYYKIPIKYGSDAVATQWIDNPERRKQQSKYFTKFNTDREPSTKRSFKSISDEYAKYNMKVLKRYNKNHYTYLECECNVCGYKVTKTLRNSSRGCQQCAIDARTFADQDTVLAQRRKTRTWRKEVLERDSHTCQICGNIDLLRVHHIENFATNEDLRIDIDNGITMCAFCHDCGYDGSFHMIYSVYNNDRNQLEDYKLNYKEYQKINSGKQLALL